MSAVSSKTLFPDIDNHWARRCIEALAQRKVLLGNPHHPFRPNAPITRMEFAQLLYWVFPQTPRQRSAISFRDVPSTHPSAQVVTWSYERGFFSGYRNRTFRPDAPLTRLEAILVLANGMNLIHPLSAAAIVSDYFDDAATISHQAQRAIAAATLAGVIVNYPQVRQLRPYENITRAEVAALLCQVFRIPNTLSLRYIPWHSTLDALQPTDRIPFSALQSNPPLVRQLQAQLQTFKLYPRNQTPDGQFSDATERALRLFCTTLNLPHQWTRDLDVTLAQALLTTEPVCFILAQAKNRTQVFQEFLRQQAGHNAAKLAFLDKGIHQSILEPHLKQYPLYLERSVHQIARSSQPTTSPSKAPSLLTQGKLMAFTNREPKQQPKLKPDFAASLTRYPQRGTLPTIDTAALDFLHEDIPYACICVGDVVDGQLQVRWLGRNPLNNVELWSATKIIPLLELVDKMNSRTADADIDNQLIRARGSKRGFSIYELAVDMINYKSSIGSSNSLAAMFKQFEAPQRLEAWLKGITGNQKLVFRGRYGEGAFINTPEVWDKRLKQVVLTATPAGQRGPNSISTYDLTRIITMLGWHPHLPPQSQLPGAQWKSLESVIRAMGSDSARYVDVALERLGLEQTMASPVVISKLGFGRSGQRNRTELVYSALVQFIDYHNCDQPGGLRLRTIGMTLLGAKKLGNGDREATELDARMAAEVTEILRRLVTDSLVT